METLTPGSVASMLLSRAGSLNPRGGRSCVLWQRLLGGQRLSMGDYVTGLGATRGATAAGGRSC